MMGNKDDMAQIVDKETELLIQKLAVRVNTKTEEALQRLLTVVYDIKPAVHHNTIIQ